MARDFEPDHEDEQRTPNPASRSDLDETGGRRGAFQRKRSPDGGKENACGAPGGARKHPAARKDPHES